MFASSILTIKIRRGARNGFHTKLAYVHTSAMSWDRFVSSLLTLHQTVCVTLQNTDIDEETVRKMQISYRTDQT